MAKNNSPQHILNLSGEQRRRFIESFDWVFSDIDGVIYNIRTEIPNANQAYMALERAGKRLTYVTNNSMRSVDQTVRRFAKSNLQVKPEQIWHPAQTLVYYLRSIQFDGLIFIMASPHFKAVLQEAGFKLLEGPNHFIKETFEDLAQNIFDKQPVRAVVIDVDFNLTTSKLLRAHLYLRNPDCLLISGATDRLLPVGEGVNIIGPGAFASMLVEASGRQLIAMGKPGRVLGDMLIKEYNITNPRRVLMIGDMLEQDVRFGRMFGFQTLLVLTGGCTLEQMLAERDPDLVPDYYADSVVDLVQFLEEITPKAHG